MLLSAPRARATVQVTELRGNIRVLARVRSLIEKERTSSGGGVEAVTAVDEETLAVAGPVTREFSFDRVLGPSHGQAQVRVGAGSGGGGEGAQARTVCVHIARAHDHATAAVSRCTRRSLVWSAACWMAIMLASWRMGRLLGARRTRWKGRRTTPASSRAL